jgi:16S rRNA (uracil1498-N3)-methyltransferase
MSIINTKTRLFIPAHLQMSVEIQLSPDHAHFLGKVLRLKVGDRVSVFNENDGEWAGTLTALKKLNALLTLDQQTREGKVELGPWLAFTPLKKNRIQMIIEKATELGVQQLFPVITENTIGGRVNRDRMIANAVEAAEQCERLSVPVINVAQSLNDLLSNWPKTRCLLVGDETGTGAPIADIISSKDEKFEDYGILIGPEGGFKPVELEHIKAQKFSVLMDLGPRVLRAETAAIAAIASLMALT